MEPRPGFDPQAHRLKRESRWRSSSDSRLALVHFNCGGVISQCLLLSALVSALASCGGGADESGGEFVNSSKLKSSSVSSSPGGLLGTGCQSFSEILSSADGICYPVGNTSSNDNGSGSSSTANLSLNIADFSELEPNDSPVSATPVAFPSRLGADVVGIEMSGSVLDGSDPSDFFVLSPLLGKSHLIYLCETTCLEHPTDSKVAIRVFDESLNLVAGNPLNGESTKFVSANLDAGLNYYIQIVAIGTGSLEYPYRLVVIE